jgi:hypothetical protein
VRKLILILILLSSIVIADRTGLVVQFDNSTVIKKCIEFQSGASAYDILNSSGLSLVTKDYGAGLGMAVCKIGDTGCDANDCFCQSSYWGFYYMSGGKWGYAPVGISSYDVKNGEVLGFRWGLYGDQPELHSFSEVCASSAQNGGGQVRYFSIAIDGNCTEELFAINVKERDVGTIWEPTPFFLAGNLPNSDVEYGVGIRVLLHQTYFGKDAGFEKVAVLFTNKDGNASFIPDKPGGYRLEFEKEGFLREEREFVINECKRTIVAAINSIEELKPQKNEVEPNTTRVDIIAPESAVTNSTVIVKLLSDKGEPLAYESIIVEFSGGRKELVTNESGEATFSPQKEGVYSYSSPNRTLYTYAVTNIVEPKIELKNLATPAMQGVEGPGVSMATAGISPEILGGTVVLILIMLYFIQRVM